PRQHRHQLIDAVEIVDLQQVDALDLEPLERALKALLPGDTVAAEEATAARGELGGDEHLARELKGREHIADDGFAVPIRGSGIDHRTAHLVHATDLILDRVAIALAELVGPEPDGGQALTRDRNRAGDERQL